MEALAPRLRGSQWGAALRVGRLVGRMEERRLHAADRSKLCWLQSWLTSTRSWASGLSWSTSVSNIIKNLSNLAGELDSLQVDGADDAGDEQSCLCCETRSAASRLEGGESGMVHAHERTLVGRAVGCRAPSRAAQLE